MSNYSTDCISGAPGQAALANITACQAAANTTFCWPPNGTRICVPGPDIPFYWPPSYYLGSNVEIGFTLLSMAFPVWENDGNMTEPVGYNEYEHRTISVPGEQNARLLDIFMHSREISSKEVRNHRGPTLILVKTAAFDDGYKPPQYKYPSGNDDDDKDPLTNMSSGQMAGTIIAILVVIIGFIIACCCCGCCGGCGGCAKKRPARPTIDGGERARVIVQGTELMEQRKSGKAPALPQPLGNEERVGEGSAGQDEITRTNEARARDFIDPPPKYTP